MEFSVELQTSDVLHRVVQLGGAMLGMAGLALILHTGLPAALRAVMALAWILRVISDIAQQARGARRAARLRLTAKGALTVLDAAGGRERARLLPGSVVIRRAAWLRIELANGCRYGELLLPVRSREGDWHRLQLLWQQCRGRIGGA